MKWADMSLEEKAAAINAGVGADKSAKTIGLELGTTRNAIIGFAGRNKDICKLRPSFTPSERLIRKTRRRRLATAIPFATPQEPVQAVSPVPAVLQRPAPRGGPVPFLARRMGFECAWIETDTQVSTDCCGAPVVGHGSWCRRHLQRVAA